MVLQLQPNMFIYLYIKLNHSISKLNRIYFQSIILRTLRDLSTIVEEVSFNNDRI